MIVVFILITVVIVVFLFAGAGILYRRDLVVIVLEIVEIIKIVFVEFFLQHLVHLVAKSVENRLGHVVAEDNAVNYEVEISALVDVQVAYQNFLGVDLPVKVAGLNGDGDIAAGLEVTHGLSFLREFLCDLTELLAFVVIILDEGFAVLIDALHLDDLIDAVGGHKDLRVDLYFNCAERHVQIAPYRHYKAEARCCYCRKGKFEDLAFLFLLHREYFSDSVANFVIKVGTLYEAAVFVHHYSVAFVTFHYNILHAVSPFFTDT